jgi:Uma2 family endonuclease
MATIDEDREAVTEISADRAKARRDRLLHGPGPRRIRWTADEYYRLADRGFFRNRRVELIEGDIIAMHAVNPPRSISVDLSEEALRTAFGPGHRIRVQQPLDLGRKVQPEPDLAVVRGEARDFAEHPRTALLIMEVSDTSLDYDRFKKGHIYSTAGILDYWILNLQDRQLEIYREPGPDPQRQGRYRYASQTIVPADGHATPLTRPEARIAVIDLLP